MLSLVEVFVVEAGSWVVERPRRRLQCLHSITMPRIPASAWAFCEPEVLLTVFRPSSSIVAVHVVSVVFFPHEDFSKALVDLELTQLLVWQQDCRCLFFPGLETISGLQLVARWCCL